MSVTLLVVAILAGIGRAAILDPMTAMRDDISRIKVMMETVGEQMERFNGLYLNKLENRLLASATSLAHIDSNVKNLQERAHVWDTFQLHVSAWNEQIKSVDKKLDILSRGAEKWEILDEKMATLLPMDDRLAKLMAKLEETDAKVTEMQRKMGNGNGSTTSSAVEAPLFSEFTSRGVLSALKDVEVKVTKMASAPARKEDREMQQKTLDVVNDVAGKVDFILDKMQVVKRSQQKQSPDDASEDVYDDGSDSDYTSGPSSSDGTNQAERSFVKLWRRMLQPVRRANKRFETLDKVLTQLDKVVANATKSSDDALLDCCRGNDAAIQSLVRSVQVLSETVRAGQQEPEFIRQLGDSLKDEMSAGIERIRQTCTVQRKKSLPVSHGSSSNSTTLITSDQESTTEGSIERQAGQPTPVDDPDTANNKRNADESQEPPTADSGGKTGVKGCHDLRLAGESESRIYSLTSGKELNEGGRDYNTRYCDMTTDGGGWTVIQRRGDYGLPRENFSVNWRDYKLGFGQLDREFWFGNDFIHRLTNEHDVVLRVELWDFDDGHVYADYESFRVDSEEDLYRLWVEGYQGNATDSLGSHNGFAFSTFDRDNDEAPPCCPCAPAYGGGWWFYSCFEANLNGEYHVNPTDNDYFRGIIWELWRGDYSLRSVELKVRPHDFPRMLPQVTTTTTVAPIADDIIPEDP